MMNRRALAALSIGICLVLFCVTHCYAEPRHQRSDAPDANTCRLVREFVAMVGLAEAERLARASGQSEARIAAARKCLE